MKELNILQQKQVVCNGFVQYSQEIIELAKQGYVLDIRNKTCPNFMLGLFVCTMLLLDKDVVEDSNPLQEPKIKRTYAKSEQKKEGLRSKLPAEALQTITK